MGGGSRWDLLQVWERSVRTTANNWSRQPAMRISDGQGAFPASQRAHKTGGESDSERVTRRSGVNAANGYCN